MNPLASSTNKATIGDVARLAGVSIKTVSRVANGLPHVRDITRNKVQRAIDKLEYIANPYAKHLGSLRHAEHNQTIAIIPKPNEIQANQSGSESREIDWW